jgi:hypothetical protein
MFTRACARVRAHGADFTEVSSVQAFTGDGHEFAVGKASEELTQLGRSGAERAGARSFYKVEDVRKMVRLDSRRLDALAVVRRWGVLHRSAER